MEERRIGLLVAVEKQRDGNDIQIAAKKIRGMSEEGTRAFAKSKRLYSS